MYGRTAYERSFKITFYAETDPGMQHATGHLSRVLVSPHRLGLPHHLFQNKGVALIGNGHIRNAGPLIEAHDVVVRLKSMRNWKHSETEDGRRIDLWAGLPSHAIHEDHLGQTRLDPVVATIIDSGIPIWAVTPFHITCSAFRVLSNLNILDRLIVSPSCHSLFDDFCRIADGEDVSDLYSVVRGGGLIGLSQFELLLTGTRVALLAELSGAKSIGLFGLDFFTTEPRTRWSGHDFSADLRILLSLRRRMLAAGKAFYWHEQERVLAIRNE